MRRSPTSTATLPRLRRRRGSRERRAQPPAGRRGVHAQVERFLHTDFTVVAYEPYIALAERLGALAPITGGTRARSSTRAPRRSRTRSSSRGSTPVGRRRRVRGRVPRPYAARSDDDLADASVQDGPRPVRAGGLSCAVPERLPRPGCDTALAALERMFTTHVAADHIAAIVFEPQQGEGGFIPAPPAFVAACGGSATSTGSSSSPTRCRRDSGEPGGCLRWSTSTSRRT